MPLYEIVLSKPDGTDEVRLTDRRPALGDTLFVGNRRWQVVLERDPADVRASAGFLCELTREQRGRALAAREQSAAMRRRMETPEKLGVAGAVVAETVPRRYVAELDRAASRRSS